MAENNKKNLPKLTNSQVLEIKELLRDERRIRQEWIAKKYGVSQSTISHYYRQVKMERQSALIQE